MRDNNFLDCLIHTPLLVEFGVTEDRMGVVNARLFDHLTYRSSDPQGQVPYLCPTLGNINLVGRGTILGDESLVRIVESRWNLESSNSINSSLPSNVFMQLPRVQTGTDLAANLPCMRHSRLKTVSVSVQCGMTSEAMRS